MLYVLRLEDDKYYIGYTSNISERITSHFSGGGGTWTQRYKPIEVIETIQGGKIEERNLTLQYMRKFGWENVRGGGWSAVVLKGKPRCL